MYPHGRPSSQPMNFSSIPRLYLNHYRLYTSNSQTRPTSHNYKEIFERTNSAQLVGSPGLSLQHLKIKINSPTTVPSSTAFPAQVQADAFCVEVTYSQQTNSNHSGLGKRAKAAGCMSHGSCCCFVWRQFGCAGSRDTPHCQP